MCEIIQDDRPTPAETANDAADGHLQCIGTPQAESKQRDQQRQIRDE
jgi:hypothetical protein